MRQKAGKSQNGEAIEKPLKAESFKTPDTRHNTRLGPAQRVCHQSQHLERGTVSLPERGFLPLETVEKAPQGKVQKEHLMRRYQDNSSPIYELLQIIKKKKNGVTSRQGNSTELQLLSRDNEPS